MLVNVLIFLGTMLGKIGNVRLMHNGYIAMFFFFRISRLNHVRLISLVNGHGIRCQNYVIIFV